MNGLHDWHVWMLKHARQKYVLRRWTEGTNSIEVTLQKRDGSTRHFATRATAERHAAELNAKGVK